MRGELSFQSVWSMSSSQLIRISKATSGKAWAVVLCSTCLWLMMIAQCDATLKDRRK